MFTLSLSLDSFEDSKVWEILEIASDRNGGHVVEFDAPTEQEAWDRVVLLMKPYLQQAVCDPYFNRNVENDTCTNRK